MIPRRSSLSLSFTVFLTKKGSWGANWLKVRRWLARAPQIRWQARLRAPCSGLACVIALQRGGMLARKIRARQKYTWLSRHAMTNFLSLQPRVVGERERSSRQASYPRVLMCHNLNTRRPFLSPTSNSGQFLLTNYSFLHWRPCFNTALNHPYTIQIESIEYNKIIPICNQTYIVDMWSLLLQDF